MLDKEKKLTQEELDDLISQVYNVALDPSRYEDLLDKWEGTVAPLRSNSQGHTLLDEPRIAEHFERADTVLERIGTQSQTNEIDTILNQFDNAAALIISGALKIEGINAPAIDLLGVHAGDSISSLQLDEDDRPALSRQIARMIGDKNVGNSVLRVRGDKQGRFIIFHMRRAVMWDGSSVIIAVTSAIRWPDGFDEVLVKAFGLSKAETGVVKLLIDCSSVKEIADLRGRSVETVRAQVKAILTKTETRSQIELVRVILSMMDIAAVTLDANPVPRLRSSGEGKLKDLPFSTVVDEKGRSLDYLILGDPKGVPLLYLHMDFGFIRWPATAETQMEQEGIKVIVPVRAGFGKSDRVPKGENFAKMVAQDILLVLEVEKVTSCPCIAQGGDQLFGLMAERLQPGTLKALIATAGVYPFTRPVQVERMHKWHRFIQAGAKYTPHLLPFLVKAGFQLARRGGKRAFVHSVFGDSPADITTFEDPEVFEALITGSEVCLSQSHSAHVPFTQQAIFEHSSAAPELMKWSEGKLPFHSFNGMQDPGMHRDTVTEHGEDYPWIKFHLYEEAGQLLFFRHWRDVISLAKSYI